MLPVFCNVTRSIIFASRQLMMIDTDCWKSHPTSIVRSLMESSTHSPRSPTTPPSATTQYAELQGFLSMVGYKYSYSTCYPIPNTATNPASNSYPTSHSLILQFYSAVSNFIMCYREVYQTRYACGHEQPTSERKVNCNSPRCRYSPVHPPNCPACHATCAQTLQRARMMDPRIGEGLCYHCEHGVA